MRKRLRQNAGVAMILLLCAAALFLALAASLVYSASVLTATANQQQLHEQCYQLAKSFNAVLEKDLCADRSANPGGDPINPTVYDYANKFLDEYYNLYDPDNIGNTTYSYSTTVAAGDQNERFGTITVRLYKEETGEDATNIKNFVQTFRLGPGGTDDSGTVGQQLDNFEKSPLNDYRFSIQVTAELSGDSYLYSTGYYRWVQYGIQYSYKGTPVFRSGSGWTITPGGSPVSFPSGEAVEIEGRYNTGQVISRTFIKEGE